jgi:hypothetical protein
MNRKNHTIIFRADESIYDFLGEISEKLSKVNKKHIDRSETVRKIVNWYMMVTLLREVNMKGLENRFKRKFYSKDVG